MTDPVHLTVADITHLSGTIALIAAGRALDRELVEWEDLPYLTLDDFNAVLDKAKSQAESLLSKNLASEPWASIYEAAKNGQPS